MNLQKYFQSDISHWVAVSFTAFILLSLSLSAQLVYGQKPPSFTKTQTAGQDIARWKQEAQDVTIYRDDWGIAHVYAKTNAEAVFGMEFAQAEDNFKRVEFNYLQALGILSMARGKSAIYKDLRRKLFINPEIAKKKYASSPDWLKTLMDAFADGLNYYLYTHPEVKPRVIKHFEPWMAMTFTEGSIGGDIYHVSEKGIAEFYGNEEIAEKLPENKKNRLALPPVPVLGSNGIAISPKNTLDHHSLLLINPHLTFYFRDELQMVSKEGLDAYGQVTWGQFFIYQGFNKHDGWMHTSSGVENITHYLEMVTKKNDKYYYRYGDKELPVKSCSITVRYKTSNGMKSKTFTAYYTQHGPIVGKKNGKWESVHLMMHRHQKALTQDWQRMKTQGYKDFKKTMELHTNSSNNTIFADSKGNIAYWHSDWIPKRNDSFDWGKPVDGSNPATAMHGVLSLKETPHLLNPPNGWLYNSNNWPWSAAGRYSPKRKNFPSYVDHGKEESPRGYHAVKLLSGKKGWTMASLAAVAYDSYLPPFSRMIPTLVAAYDAAPDSDSLKAKLNKQIVMLRNWDYRWGINSISTSLAVFWGRQLYHQMREQSLISKMSVTDYVAKQAKPRQLLQALSKASDRLKADFGYWQVPWGHINRYQRLKNVITPHHFSDAKPSIPVPFTSSRWGSLASFGARPYPGTKKWYGNNGNSFVCVVEFGPKVRAWAVKVGGISGDPDSPHFKDQQALYAQGNLRTVYYYKSQLTRHTERKYHPGE